jgi:hypothetical protein
MPVVAAESMKPRNRTSVWLLLYRSRRFSEIGSENRKSLRFEKPLLSAGGISCHSMKAVVANNRASEVRYPHATAVAEGAIVTPARPIMAPAPTRRA